MRYDKSRPSAHQLVHAVLDDLLSPRIDRAGRLIQDQYRRIGNGRTCDRKELPLALGQIGTVSFEHGVVALRKPPYEAVGVCEFRCRHDLFFRGIQFSVSDILFYRTCEQVRILQHDAERPAQIRFFDLVDIDVVVADLTVLNIVEAVDQVGDGRLPRSRRTDQGDLLARSCMDHDVMKDHLVIPIAEVDTVECHVAFQFLVSRAVIRLLVIVFPSPVSCVFFCLHNIAVLVVLAVDQHDIALIRLRRLVEESKDPLGARKSHNNAVELHADLVDRHTEALIECQKACQSSDCEPRIRIQRQKRADKGHDYVVGIPHLGIDRSDHIGESVRLESALVELLIEFVESLDRLFLVAEHLDHLLPGHGLLDEAVELTDISLLRDKVLARVLRHLHRQEQHQGYHHQRDESQSDVQDQHHCQNTDDRDGAVEQLRNTLADHLAQCVDIIRIDRHDIAVGMRIEIFDRKALHMIEQILPHPLERALVDAHHSDLLQIGGTDPDAVEHSHTQHSAHERPVIRVGVSDHRRDIVVDQRSCKHRPLDVSQDR